jgi:hypothetical protein
MRQIRKIHAKNHAKIRANVRAKRGAKDRVGTLQPDFGGHTGT